ncbi:MAG TPA: T9SS type A sorting domain-containing protein, partial [Bacteroidia bacterium]|nr:T9SS type A sorting domain-containing protein [Bacteroidia bacterium]
DTLIGYYEYTTTGSDSGNVQATLSKNGSQVGGIDMNLSKATSWTYFSMPFSTSTQPDTLRIDIQSSVWSSNAKVGSTLLLDNLALKSTIVGLTNINNTLACKSYPNPVKDLLMIELKEGWLNPVHIYVYDITGKVIMETNSRINNGLVYLNTSGLSSGIYFFKVDATTKSVINKFIKE